jgi:multidrug transporter EmrE-like cation transporter
MSISEIFGDFGFKGVARNPSIQNWSQGLLGYTGVIYFFIKSLKVGNVTYVNALWDGMSGLIETVAAYLILGEKLKTKWQYIGIIMIAAGLVLVKSGGIPY